jgi:hypothetical protein
MRQVVGVGLVAGVIMFIVKGVYPTMTTELYILMMVVLILGINLMLRRDR